MGQMQSSPTSTFYSFGGVSSNSPAPSGQPQLRFSSKHGENCQILRDGTHAKRTESFCKGIVFSDRPVECGERVCIRLTELSIRWSGVLRLGFTSHNPTTVQSLPKYACPDLTGKPGYWAKALAERYAESNALIHYYFTPNGDVHFGVNGRDKGIFFSGVDTRQPLWCLIDLYGNCTAIELVDMRRSLNNFARSDEVGAGNSGGSAAGGSVNEAAAAVEDAAETSSEQDNMANALDALTLDGNNSINELEMPLRFNSSARFRDLKFHTMTGPNISLNSTGLIAWRHEDEYSNGYVFTGEPLRPGERIVVQILATENMYIGSLAFGLTSCDPASLDPERLPEDSDMLLDRSEYWVVSKDVANTPEEGDELSFCVRPDGSVEFSKNGAIPSVFMHVDNSVSLWAFWDIYGNTQRLRIVGATTDPVIRPDQIRQNSSASMENDRNNLSMSDLVLDSSVGAENGEHLGIGGEAPPLPPPRRAQSSHTISASTSGPESQQSSSSSRSQDNRNGSDECKICYEATVDCVLYICGHMCLCYECALQQWKGRGGGICPMCRNTIQDVIKIYRS